MGKITVSEERTVVEVTPWPDEVQVVVHVKDGTITPAQARQMATLLNEAADKCRFLDWVEDEKTGDLKVVELAVARSAN